ncbi:MAG: hypothetical protein ACT4OK_14815 [Gemmobacter sp.]
MPFRLTLLAPILALATPALAEAPLVRSAATGAVVSRQDAPSPGFIVTGGMSLEFTDGEYGRDTGTSVSVDAYLEAEVNGFYLGVYGEMTDEESDDEVNLYLGYRSELASGLSWDVGYTRYYYPNDGGDCCGEVTLGLYQPLGDSFALGLDLAWDPDAEIGNAYVYGEYYVSDKWTLSANWGVYEVEEAPSEQEWDFGAGYAITDKTALDLRWYDGSEYDGYVALLISFDTTLLGN